MATPNVSPELEEAVKAYLLAKVYAQAIEPDVIAYQTKILAENDFRNKWHGIGGRRGQIAGGEEFVRNPKHSHRIVDEDWPMYLQLLDEAQKANGFKVPEGQCPILIAKGNVIKAEKLILKESESLTGSDNMFLLNSLSKMREFVNLTITFVLAQRPNITAQSVMGELA